MTILNSVEIMQFCEWLPPVIIFCLVTAIVSFIILSSHDHTTIGGAVANAIIVLISIVSTVIFLVMSNNDDGIPTGRYEIEAIIDESVSFKEVVEEYNFIEQRGDIYVFETKEVE